MDIGIGVPNTARGAEGGALVEWARRADSRGFSTLATIGRVAYPSHDDLITLAAAAGATERIGLMTNILLAPTHSPALLAKQAASLDSLSGGRFTLGIAPGGRTDDFEAVGRSFTDRGRRLDKALLLMEAVWRGEPVAGSPHPVAPLPARGAVPIIVGGNHPSSVERAVRHGIGWTAGGAPPQAVGEFAARVRGAWTAAGRDGTPKIVALAYFGLGDDVEAGRASLRDYYGWLGDWAEGIAGAMLATPEAVRGAVEAFEAAGVDELVFDGAIPEAAQVDLLADVVLG